ncbi:DUF481 domain-containing protein [Gaetbulibacter saemankumensis]|uniref:DUF481 domain-containing protein n=1 Tax=Gaetbulibacter saemankumensis TaxID=311208 RepID=UPI0004898F52|nr:DUF481 domain-containing protein [Gaetbulibacter saemankumensis]
MKHIMLATFILSFLFCSELSAQKNDTIVMKTNNFIIGDIKEMNNGVLVVSTKYSDSDFKIEWLQVKSLKSTKLYLINLSDGTRFNGSILTSIDFPEKVVLFNDKIRIPVRVKDIVFIKQVEQTFISRIDAELSVGFNFSKVNNLAQLSIISKISYTGSKWFFNGGYNRVSSSQDQVNSTLRVDANIGSRYFFKQDWFAILAADFLSSSEQQLKLRSATRGGMGKYIVHSNKMYFAGGTGLVWNNERYDGINIPDRNSLEAFAGLEVNLFDFGDLDLSSSVSAYPSLTEKGRFRTDFNFSFKYNLPLEFFIRLGLNYNFDNKPVENASQSDYVFQTTFGWEK